MKAFAIFSRSGFIATQETNVKVAISIRHIATRLHHSTELRLKLMKRYLLSNFFNFA